MRLRWERCPTFRESYAALGTTNESLVKRIYSTCQVAHEWCCHNVVDGDLFKCPQSYYLPKGLGPEGEERWADAIKISDHASFREELLAYLQSDVPLRSCQRCLGTVGRRFTHQQIAHREWADQQQHSTEELIDWRLLAREERSQRYPALRRLRSVVPNTGQLTRISAGSLIAPDARPEAGRTRTFLGRCLLG